MAAALEQARLARLQGITVLVAAVGDWVNMKEVRQLASYPDRFNVIAADYEFLPSIETQIKRAVCNGETTDENVVCAQTHACTVDMMPLTLFL